MTKSFSDDSGMLQFQRTVADSGGRWTKEREALLQIICTLDDHFLADDVLYALRKRGFAVALTTVYRNLALLMEAGIIRRACLHEEGMGGIRYERIWGKRHHDHLICAKCDKRVEFSYPAIDILQEAVAKEHGFRLTSHHLELVGICAECQKKESDLNPTSLKNQKTPKLEGADQQKRSGIKMTLAEVKKNVVVEVYKLSCEAGAKAKLKAMGLNLGDKVKLLRAGPFQGPLLIEFVESGGKIMIAKQLAKDIHVQEEHNGK